VLALVLAHDDQLPWAQVGHAVHPPMLTSEVRCLCADLADVPVCRRNCAQIRLVRLAQEDVKAAILVEALQCLFQPFPSGGLTRVTSHEVDLVFLRYAALCGEDRLSSVDDFEQEEPRSRPEADSHHDERLAEVFRPIAAVLGD
jgi:hypothetical protein